MKIALIHGIGHQGSTWHYADLICQELDKLGPLEKSEFFYPGICPISVRAATLVFIRERKTAPTEIR